MSETDKRRNRIGGIYLEKTGWPDNLGIALLSYFEGHLDCPEDDPKDENGNSEWALMKTNEALDLIAEELGVN